MDPGSADGIRYRCCAGLPCAGHRRVIANLHDLHFALSRHRAPLVGLLRVLDLEA